MPSPALSRSQRAAFLLIVGLGALAVVSVTAVVASYVASPRPASFPPRDEVIVDLGIAIAGMPVGDALHLAAPSRAPFRMVDGGGANRAGGPAPAGWFVRTAHGSFAFAANSSHLGCSVGFDATTQDFIDPCGGSVFAIDGAVVHGPAGVALSHLAWRQVGQTAIAVETLAPPG